MNDITCNIVDKKWDYNDLIKFVLDKYSIDGVSLMVIEDKRIVDKFSSKDIEIEAMLVNYPGNRYVLYIRPGYASLTIFCHEMVHLWQYYRGDLKSLNDFREYEWCGEIWDNKSKYNSRPWEKEAFKLEGKLRREYKKFIKNKNK